MTHLYNKGECVFVFFIGGHTVGPTELKLGMKDHIYPGEVIGYILFLYPNPQGQGALKTDFSAGWRFSAGLELKACVENAQGEDGYPCKFSLNCYVMASNPRGLGFSSLFILSVICPRQVFREVPHY